MRFKFFKNQKGSTMVTTLVAVTFLTILGTIILASSSMNLQMKMTDKKMKKDFYKDEQALSDVYNGIGQKLSYCFGNAYTDVLSKVTTSTGLPAYKTEEEAYRAFCNIFLNEVMTLYPSATPADINYVKNVLSGYITVGGGGESAAISKLELQTRYKAPGDVTTAQFVFQNMVLVYRDGNGYESAITTDIVVDMPTVTFFNEHDNLLDYAVIGNQGVFVKGNGSSVSVSNISGNIYAGIAGAKDNKYPGVSFGEQNVAGGLNLYNSALNITANYVVSKGDINVRDGAALSIEGIDGVKANVWAESIRTAEPPAVTHTSQNADVSISGNVFAANDLELNSYNSNVSLKGAFYGYNNGAYETEEKGILGSDREHTQSSSIIINGKNCTLDLRNLTTMLVSGLAYIDLESKYTASSTNEYKMGESMSVKTNQNMYLMPDEYLACSNPVAAGSRPANVMADTTAIDSWFVKTNGWLNNAAPVITKTVSIDGTSYDYLYINFVSDAEKREYAKTILEATKKKVDDAANQATIDPIMAAELTKWTQAYELKKQIQRRMLESAGNSIEVNDAAECRIYGLGALQSVISNPSDGSRELAYVANTAAGADYAALSVGNMGTRYQRLYKLLDPKEEYAMSQSVPPVTQAEYTYGSYIADENTLPLSKFVNLPSLLIPETQTDVINNYYAYVSSSNIDITGNVNGIILSRGDVTVKNGCTVEGIILAGGKVYLEDGASVKANRSIVQKVLEEEIRMESKKAVPDEESKKRASYYLINYSSGSGGGVLKKTSEDYTDYMNYQNWRKGDVS